MRAEGELLEDDEELFEEDEESFDDDEELLEDDGDDPFSSATSSPIG